MDPQWKGAPPPGSITCMLCRGSVPFAKNETHHFRSHLQHHHGVFYHHDVLISVNTLSKEYLSRIVQEYEKSGDKSELVGEEGEEEVIELEEAAEKVSNNSVILPNRTKNQTDEANVHNCKTCNAKFGELRDFIEHVNGHKAEERREQEEIEMRKQALENERRRLIEEKRVIKQQKEIEKRRLEGEKAKMQREIQNKRLAEQIENENRTTEFEKNEMDEINARNRKDVERSRGIAELKAGLKQIRETHRREESLAENQEQVGHPEVLSNLDVENAPRPIVFECPDCPYTAKRNIELKLHRLSHTDEKNIACEYCDEKFYLERQLKRHTMSKHANSFDKKSKPNKTVFDEPRHFVEMDSSLPIKPFEDETMIAEENSQFTSHLDQSLPKKKSKRPKIVSAQDRIMNVLSEDSNPDSPRPKSRASLGRGISDIAANSEYFQKFPNQIKKSFAEDDRFDSQDPSLPEGWKFREIRRPNGRVDKEYCSPDYMVFRSKKAMVEYMKVMGSYSQEEMDRAEKGK